MSDCKGWSDEERAFIERANRFAILLQRLDEAHAQRRLDDFRNDAKEFEAMAKKGFTIDHLPQPYLPEVWAAALLVKDTYQEFERRVSGAGVRAIMAKVYEMLDHAEAEQRHEATPPGMLN